ncbi:MAG: glucokinase [Gammaproteobacteria bacterium]|nr:MAG: glucokinase [Gammaproteobacteria bacterium]
MRLLVADIGGTNTRCTVGTTSGELGKPAVFRNAEFPDLATLLTRYLEPLHGPERPEMAAIAVAAPIRSDTVQMINLNWHFSRRGLQRQLQLQELHVLNDFAALAWSLPTLAGRDLVQVGTGVAAPGYPKAVLGPGTGLGVAGLIALAEGWQAIPGEGGHVTLPAQDEREEQLIRAARERFGHCSAERLLSGAGLSFLHQALHGGETMPPEQIGAQASARDAPALETLEVFFRLLGSVAGNLALTLGAFGGVYIGGGIVPRFVEAFSRSGFRDRFESKGRYRDYMRGIPTWVITAPYPTLNGLLAFAAARTSS